MRPNYTLPRIYLDQPLSGEIDLSREHAHYFGTVLRKNVGDSIRIFNGRDGEWSAVIVGKTRKAMRVSMVAALRPPTRVPDIRLLFAPIRKNRFATVIEKATELGVRTMQPVLTKRTQFPNVNLNKARMQIIEAAEQTERLDLPDIRTPMPLDAALKTDRTIIFADEAGGACVVGAVSALKLPVDVLIGPEGGFTVEEREAVRGKAGSVAVSLGPRILRADTAAVGLLMIAQSTIGDCRQAWLQQS
ncbi:MAG: 16S rRNA (uracil(1498)-N(3))-methyltransferase [Pseudomonadota bacterium]